MNQLPFAYNPNSAIASPWSAGYRAPNFPTAGTSGALAQDAFSAGSGQSLSALTYSPWQMTRSGAAAGTASAAWTADVSGCSSSGSGSPGLGPGDGLGSGLAGSTEGSGFTGSGSAGSSLSALGASGNSTYASSGEVAGSSSASGTSGESSARFVDLMAPEEAGGESFEAPAPSTEAPPMEAPPAETLAPEASPA
jgi:hypothetical protein